MIDAKIARVKKLIEEREAIDAELGAIFGLSQNPKRGRPRKDDKAEEAEPPSQTSESGSPAQ
jgi:hypothetical protein